MFQPKSIIRFGGESDIETLVDSSCFMIQETEGREIPRSMVREGVVKNLAHPDGGFYLVADVEGRPAGSIHVATHWIDVVGGCMWWFQCLHVRQEYRSRGTFFALVRRIKDLAAANPDVKAFRSFVHPENKRMQKISLRGGWEQGPLLVFRKNFF